MSLQFSEIPRDQLNRYDIGDSRRHTMTPFFSYQNVFNEVQSRLAGKPVYELKAMVEIRFAGNPQYRPMMGVDEQAEMDDNGRIVTWAEKFKDQYQAFVAGAAQEAEGTPLEELLPYGISQAQLSMCRALDINSIEALCHLEGPAMKRLGQVGNDIKPMAKRFMDARNDGSQAQREINELKRQIAAMGGAPDVTEVAEDDEDADDAADQFADRSDADLKDEIALLNDGKRPQGNPSRATLESMLSALKAE
jgi:hypothetical protein